MDIEEWRAKHGTIKQGDEASMTAILERHIVELEKEVEECEKRKQVHGHQDIWIKFLSDILDDKDPDRRTWI